MYIYTCDREREVKEEHVCMWIHKKTQSTAVRVTLQAPRKLCRVQHYIVHSCQTFLNNSLQDKTNSIVHYSLKPHHLFGFTTLILF